jgi:hypothetical protein
MACFLLLLFLTATAFYPGLGGSLTFDDAPNLQPWKDIGDIRTWHNVLTFSFSSKFTPGRPLSLLSFLIDDQSWLPDIFSLKRTNLALHLINTCLIFWLCLRLFRYLLPATTDTQKNTWLAMLATAIWSLHPIQVSNVSYIIQRMNLLSTTLELGGLLLFIQGREQLTRTPKKALVLCSIAIGVFMPAAILAKENGLLLCAFALLVEHFCFTLNAQTTSNALNHPPRWWALWKYLFLWAPLILFLLYSLMIYHGFTTGFQGRDYNAWERLLTQGPVLIDYLHKLLLPHLQGSGLYFDNFPISRSLFNPLSTFVCWALLLALLIVAASIRRQHPLIAFGVFFYFCGHLMESTVLPLDMYYEHRNYLPQIGIWVAVVGLYNMVSPPLLKSALATMAVAILALLVLLTRNNAFLWSHPDLQAAIWYNDNPGSLRSTLSYANELLLQGEPTAAQKILETGITYHPNNLSLYISHRYINCYWKNQVTSFDDLPSHALTADFETASIILLERMRAAANQSVMPAGTLPTSHDCHPASTQQIATIYRSLLKNPLYARGGTAEAIYQHLAEIAVEHRHLNEAIQYYDQAFANSQNPIYPYRQALLLLWAGLPQDALRYNTQAEQALTWKNRLTYPDLPRRIDRLKVRLSPTPRTSQP